MGNILTIDTSWHPLVTGYPPEWASEWGEDRYGVFVAFILEGFTQRLRWIPPGRFWMGSPEEETQVLAKDDWEREWFEQEQPRHEVFITRGFWLFDTPCTQALWEAVMGENPSRFKGSDRPVERVSWNDAQEFITRINTRIPGLELSLPTDAQWEHACRVEPGADRVIRGGAWDDHARYCRSAFRSRDVPDNRNYYLGFRCARVQVS